MRPHEANSSSIDGVQLVESLESAFYSLELIMAIVLFILQELYLAFINSSYGQIVPWSTYMVEGQWLIQANHETESQIIGVVT